MAGAVHPMVVTLIPVVSKSGSKDDSNPQPRAACGSGQTRRIGADLLGTLRIPEVPPAGIEPKTSTRSRV